MTLKVQGTYFEAAVTNINASERALTARFPCHAGLEEFEFTVPYDILIYSVGSKVNTFGIKVLIFQPRSQSINCDQVVHVICFAQSSELNMSLTSCYTGQLNMACAPACKQHTPNSWQCVLCQHVKILHVSAAAYAKS